MRARVLLAAALLSALAACERSGPPAPVIVGPGAQPQQQRPAPAPQAAAVQAPIQPGAVHIAREGDTVFTLARRSGVPTRAIIDANNLQAPFALTPGQRVNIPAVRVHEVRAGETASVLAQRYGVSLAALVRANGIEPPYNIRVGQRLVIPGATAAAPTVAAAPRGTVEQTPLPPPGAPPVATPVPAPQAVPAPAPQPAPPQQAAPPPTPANPPAAPSDANPVATPGRFLWPVRGVVVSDFGPKPGGLQNDGVNIAAPRGTPFRAAESGTVIYAGNELRGFGNLLLLRHDGGYVTAYAHADELMVQRGDQVRRGQTIGRVGQTGGVATPQLHFEIRRGTRPVNPMEYLGAQTAAN
jgi:murein DD-endopeptidase MepM/ murein hydrolase activator NlpD